MSDSYRSRMLLLETIKEKITEAYRRGYITRSAYDALLAELIRSAAKTHSAYNRIL